ncbi:MAG: DUF3450 domain-containing protein [Desulfovibrionaceae bacterium]|nr:DUF3450 domain-containing protein [Desulfovibrionaceae bacterium]
MQTRILAAALAAAILSGAMVVGASADMTAREADQTLRSAARTQAAAQAEADRWGQEREALSAEERQLLVREEWLGYQIAKHKAYIAGENAAIEDLRQRKETFIAVRQELEPLLDALAGRLERVVAADMPFLPGERAARLEHLRTALDDYHLALAEKLRRTLEALRIEAMYGEQVEVTDEALALDGQEVQGRVLRLGRLGLYCLLPDGRAGMYDTQAQAWRVLPAGVGGELAKAVEIAGRRRVVELIALPVPRVQP